MADQEFIAKQVEELSVKLGIAQEKAGGDDDTSRLVLLPITQIFHTEGELI